ncbi:protein phosphatase CheZ [Magnetovibrio sp.]|uniref:protein phosphatase CheZ n=1 Tax=Magnetovibrio sp. TaxID=2024836 RepID=UPI002F91DB14
MAGRKSNTATAKKPKAIRKPSTKSAAKDGAVKKRAVKAVDQVIAAAKKVKRKGKAVPIAAPRRAKRDPAVTIYAELERLAAYIDAAKREIAEIRPQDVKEEYLPGASDELDAIVAATADATNTIMDNCEVIEGVMGDVNDAVSAKLMDATTHIYEACTFQDITGQRIGKVVAALKNIEKRIDALVLTLGDEIIKPQKKNAKPEPTGKKEKKEITDADLLEGPQLGDKAKSQAEIDDLLASFD